MTAVDINKNRDTLDSLRIIRRNLFSIPESELSAMSLEDQVKFGDSLHQMGLAILNLETAKLKGVNDQFKKKEDELEKAASALENDLASLNDAVELVRLAADGLRLVTNIVKLVA